MFTTASVSFVVARTSLCSFKHCKRFCSSKIIWAVTKLPNASEASTSCICPYTTANLMLWYHGSLFSAANLLQFCCYKNGKLYYECIVCFHSNPQWSTVDAEIKVPSFESPKLTKFAPLKPGVGQNIATHALPAVRKFFHAPPYFANILPSF